MDPVPISVGHAASRNANPTSVGWNTSVPAPPKMYFGTAIANAAPIIGTQIGTLGGMISASRRPINTALPSFMVIGWDAAL